MKSQLLSASLVAFCLMVAGCTRTPTQPAAKTPTKAEDEAALKALYAKYDAAYTARDTTALLGTLADDVIWMVNDGPVVVGKEAVKTSIETDLAPYSAVSIKGTTEEVEVSGDWAFARGSFTWTGTPKVGGKPIESVEKFLEIDKRQPDGSWKTYCTCWNRNKPLASAAK